MTRGRVRPNDLIRYVRAVREFKPDIVHAHMIHANLLARAGRLFVRVPLVCTAHNTTEKPDSSSGNGDRAVRLREFAYRISDPFCEMTTQVSSAGAERYVATKAVPRAKMRVVRNGVDLHRFQSDSSLRERTRADLGLGKTFTWIAVARLEQAKDPWTLLDAFQKIRCARDKVLLMVGSGTLESEIKSRIAQLGLTAQVRLLGSRTDVPALLNASDAYVLSSSWEGLPIALLEAAAVGLPLVVTAAGGAPEVVVDGKSGWVVATHDSTALADRMSAVMELPVDAHTRMGKEGRNHVVSRFGLDAVLDEWQQIYRSLVDGKSRKG
jgi:glycosyltransferase involved in cell wall biosynthesis